MLTELRHKSHITLPKNITSELGLKTGDMLELSIKEGGVFICPVAVYPKKYIEELRREAEEAMQRINAGEGPAFDTMEALVAKLEEAV